jgi:hypothetical protein
MDEHTALNDHVIPAPRTGRTVVRRHPERAVPDRIEEFLRAGLVAHVAYVEDGEPRLIPFLYLYEAGHLYVHGSPGSGTLRLLRDGRPVTVSVTMIDELVASKTEMNHSANYRSAIVYGRAHRVADLDKKRRIMREMGVRYFPERQTPRDYAPATDDDLVRMELLAIEIDEAQAKFRTGGSMAPEDDDPNFPGTTYVRPV